MYIVGFSAGFLPIYSRSARLMEVGVIRAWNIPEQIQRGFVGSASATMDPKYKLAYELRVSCIYTIYIHSYFGSEYGLQFVLFQSSMFFFCQACTTSCKAAAIGADLSESHF